MQQAFYRETAKPFREGTYSITPRIQQNGTEVYWRIHAMSQLEQKEIWQRSQEQPKRYETMVLAASVCFPDLKQADLQDHYGAIGAEQLLEKMLTAGEFAALREAVEDINQ